MHDDEPMWNCGCGLLVDGAWHCPDCGSCHPSGCGFDHDEDDEHDEDCEPADPSEQGLFEREVWDALGPPAADED